MLLAGENPDANGGDLGVIGPHFMCSRMGDSYGTEFRTDPPASTVTVEIGSASGSAVHPASIAQPSSPPGFSMSPHQPTLMSSPRVATHSDPAGGRVQLQLFRSGVPFGSAAAINSGTDVATSTGISGPSGTPPPVPRPAT